MKNEFKMNSRQVTLLIFAAILEIDSLTAPTRLAQLAGPDAWLTPIFALILLIPGTALIALLGQRFPREGIIEYSRSTLGDLQVSWSVYYTPGSGRSWPQRSSDRMRTS